MKPLYIDERQKKKEPLYMSIYKHLRAQIVTGHIGGGDKMPSLRQMASNLDVSITTIIQAYTQLEVEGYIKSRAQSGYYVITKDWSKEARIIEDPSMSIVDDNFNSFTIDENPYYIDLNVFDAARWKKSYNKVIAKYSPLLFFEGDPQGEASLRYEIAKYLYNHRGVIASPDQIVIAAGTQQLTLHLCRILKSMDINHIATEDPGYLPVQKIFEGGGYTLNKIPLDTAGIKIELLPRNIPSAVYICPSNQFPTGIVMPFHRRMEIIRWARENHSIIIEDDYDSELRYFGKPIPALQGLEKDAPVVYLGSFSATIFPALRISYMVLPPNLIHSYRHIKEDYSQTCSKLEQLTLAMYMEEGFYDIHIKRLRKLYGDKLSVALSVLENWDNENNFIEAQNTNSGLNLMLKIKKSFDSDLFCQIARKYGLYITTTPLENILAFYYSKAPLIKIKEEMPRLLDEWFNI